MMDILVQKILNKMVIIDISGIKRKKSLLEKKSKEITDLTKIKKNSSIIYQEVSKDKMPNIRGLTLTSTDYLVDRFKKKVYGYIENKFVEIRGNEKIYKHEFSS